jgi:hypothetical protein
MEYLKPPGLPLGSVAWLVPDSGGFDTFTRLFHPLSDGPGGDTRWRDLARSRGLAWHPEIQFGSLASADDPHQARLANLGQEQIERVLRHVVEAAGKDVPYIAARCDIDLWASPTPAATPGGQAGEAIGLPRTVCRK